MAYISAEEAKAAKTALKKEFPEWKFSVTGGGGLSINIDIMEGPLDLSADAETGHTQLNIYYLNEDFCTHWEFYKKVLKCATDAIAAAGKPYFDKSDIQSDYFYCAYYRHLNIGKWNKPYKMVEKKK